MLGGRNPAADYKAFVMGGNDVQIKEFYGDSTVGFEVF